MKCDSSVVGHNLILGPVDQEGRCGVGALTEVGERGNVSHKVSRGRARPRLPVGGTDAVEEEGKAIAFFEEGEDELGAWVTGAHPAQVAAVGTVGTGAVVRYLLRRIWY